MQPAVGLKRRALVFISGLGQGQSLYPHHAYALTHDKAFQKRYTDVCLCELPGVSAVPLRADRTYPTARECVQAVERFASAVLALPSLDGVAHSAGAFVLSYASRYNPWLFDKSVYAEAPAVFFTHFPMSWPHLFADYSLRRLARALTTLDIKAVLNWLVMSEVHHQFALKNTTWFMECCHREDPRTLGPRAMLLLGTDDVYVNGPATAAYFARYHPDVRIHLITGWAHGGFWDPTNLPTVMAKLRAFLCGDIEVGEARS